MSAFLLINFLVLAFCKTLAIQVPLLMRIIGHYATITDRRAASESICLLSVPGSTKGSDPCAAGQPGSPQSPRST